MHIFLHKRINYGHQPSTRYAYAMHAAIFVYVPRIRAAETAPEAVRLVRQTQLKQVCV